MNIMKSLLGHWKALPQISPVNFTLSQTLKKIHKKLMGPKHAAPEGFILGVGAKIFTIAGPVIVYGLSASAVYGLIYFFTTL